MARSCKGPGKRQPAVSGVEHSNPCKVFVGSISYRITESELKEFFEEFGPVRFCQVVKDHRRGWSRGIGFVMFKSVESAEKALSAKEEELTLDSRVMRVSRPLTKKRLKSMQEAERERDEGCAVIGDSIDAAEVPFPHCHGNQDDSTGAAGERMTIPEANDDILLHVFSFLELKDRVRVERVCKQWRRVSRHSWHFIRSLSFEHIFIPFTGKYGGLTDEILQSLLQRGCQNLRRLDLSASPHMLTDFSLDLIGMHCGKLERLDLSGVSVTQTSMRQLSLKLSSLKWLRLSGCHQIGEKCLWWALHNCPDLEHLNASTNRRINGQCFYVAGNKLKTVILRSCDKLNDTGMALLLKNVPDLEVLDIGLCSELTGVSVRAAAENCSLLKLFNFAGPNPNVKMSDLLVIGRLSKLEVLNMSKQVAFTDEVLFTIGRNCLNLRELCCEACYGVTDVGLQCLTTCSDLVQLNMSYCHLVTDEGLLRVTVAGRLESLVARGCQGLSDNALCLLAHQCTSLAELDVCGCTAITSSVVFAFQESLLHMREPQQSKRFSLLAGGTSIDGELLRQFAVATGASVSLHDLSVKSLAAEYDPYMDIPPIFSEENWDDDEEEAFELPSVEAGSKLDSFAGPPRQSHAEDYDFLVADDPANFSDEFSGPEDWS